MKPVPKSAAPDAPSDRDAMLAVLRQFRALIRAARMHYRQVERECGVSGAYVWAMDEIAAAPGLRVGELARLLGIHQSTASNMVDKLQATGLVSRMRAAGDQRVVRLRLTARGRKALARAPAPRRGVLQQALASLPAARLAALHRSLALMLTHMHAAVSGDALLPDLLASGRRRAAAPAAS
jgi:DNA-binding MarR family transcriptional regulator